MKAQINKFENFNKLSLSCDGEVKAIARRSSFGLPFLGNIYSVENERLAYLQIGFSFKKFRPLVKLKFKDGRCYSFVKVGWGKRRVFIIHYANKEIGRIEFVKNTNQIITIEDKIEGKFELNENYKVDVNALIGILSVENNSSIIKLFAFWFVVVLDEFNEGEFML